MMHVFSFMIHVILFYLGGIKPPLAFLLLVDITDIPGSLIAQIRVSADLLLFIQYNENFDSKASIPLFAIFFFFF